MEEQRRDVDERDKVEDLDVSEQESEDVKGGDKVVHKDFTISHQVDKASPNLFQ